MERSGREDFRNWVTKRVFIFLPKRMGKVKLLQQRAVYRVSFFNFSAEWVWEIYATPQLLYIREGDAVFHFTGGLVGLGAGQDGYGETESLAPHPPGFEPRSTCP